MAFGKVFTAQFAHDDTQEINGNLDGVKMTHSKEEKDGEKASSWIQDHRIPCCL